MDHAARRSAPEITLIHRFAVRSPDAAGKLRELPLQSGPARRLIAYLAIAGVGRTRDHLAFTLWPDSGERQAHQSLRKAIWDATRFADLLDVRRDIVSLPVAVVVDLHALRSIADDLGRAPILSVASLCERFGRELLPDWYDDWLMVPREQWQRIRIRALESVARRMLAIGEHGLAVEAAAACVAADHFRETSRRMHVEALVADGNRARAVVEARAFRRFLVNEIGEYPSDWFDSVMATP